jgi:hypothetical protein
MSPSNVFSPRNRQVAHVEYESVSQMLCLVNPNSNKGDVLECGTAVPLLDQRTPGRKRKMCPCAITLLTFLGFLLVLLLVLKADLRARVTEKNYHELA